MNEEHTNGRTYWQSLNELANTPAVRAAIENEFPTYDPGTMVNTSRRRFLQLAGASMALAGVTLTGCRRWPKENVVPQTSASEGRIPGVPEQYASAFEIGGYAQPLLVSTYDGRPIKIEGNPVHPLTQTFSKANRPLGSSSVFAQASLLEMYDPERSRAIIHRSAEGRGVAHAPEGLLAALQGKLGGKIAVLHEATHSPTTRAQVKAFVTKAYEYEPVSGDNQFVADKQSFGQPVRQVFDLAKADIVVSFDSDLLNMHPYALRHANDWAKRRKQVDTDRTMNRMYVVESGFSTTGTVADERLPSKVWDIEKLVLQLAHKAGLESAQSGMSERELAFIDKMWADLTAHQGKVVVAGGPNLRPDVLGVINAINAKLGAYGNTITLRAETDRPSHLEQIRALVDSINAGNVDTLIILGGNPAYDAPTDLKFADALGAIAKKGGTTLHLSLYDNETSHACQWHVNRAHYLESWGDSEAWDGTICLQQPMIRPLFNGFTPASLLAMLMGETVESIMGISADVAKEVTLDQAVLYRAWSGLMNEKFIATAPAFRKALHDGFVAAQPANIRANPTKPNVSFGAQPDKESFEVRFAADYTMFDGRYANNGWLQELPDPITKVTWDNAALVSPSDAKKLGIHQDDHSTDMIKLKVGDREIEIAAFILPGHPNGVITLPLGYGRTRAGAILLTENPGSIGYKIGFDTYDVRTTTNFWSAVVAKPEVTGNRYTIASVQTHHLIEPMGFEIREKRVGEKHQGGKVVQESTLAAYLKDQTAPAKKAHNLVPLQLFPVPFATPPKHDQGPVAFNDPHAWGMTMDMTSCIGCMACVVACQAENNIPVVGKDQVIMNREMHWLRIDRYFKGSGPDLDTKILDDNPTVTYQPMTCVHCENAPCEQVCPVAATVHDSEGLNTMVYNRCIGTRYCANNCPYKIRKFNYLDYQSKHPREHWMPWLDMPDTQQQKSVNKIKALTFNPDVTVRMRGVMEKCTYCVQRIKDATIDRRNQWANGQRSQPTVDDFDVVTACQQACPTEAIVFGNLNDKDALVTRLQTGPRAYQVLQELNNRPRTHHLAKISNPVVAAGEASVEKEEVH
jgi:MoCo/4Fe-4S cofactor protein with predicted Tat translocation signal